MTYSEQLAKAKEININIGELMVAYEVEACFTLEHPQFEDICAIAYTLWLKLDNVSECQIVWAIKKKLDEGYALQDIDTNIIDYINW